MYAHRKGLIAPASAITSGGHPAAEIPQRYQQNGNDGRQTRGPFSAGRLLMAAGERGYMSKRYIILLAIGGLCCAPAHASSHRLAMKRDVASQIKSEVAENVAGINAKDIDKATKFDAPDLVSMESGRPPSLGAKADRDGLSMAFKYSPSWHLRLIDETVDVTTAGGMAIYRGTYAEDSLRDGVPFTHKGNYVAGFRRDADGTWRVHWSVVCWQSPSHKK
jgi:ketosteroid isomerase-like protein